MAPTAFIVPLWGGHQRRESQAPPQGGGDSTSSRRRSARRPSPSAPSPASRLSRRRPLFLDPADWGEKGLFPSVHAWEGDRRERPLTIPLIHHGLDDHWKHAPVQVKVQLRRRGGDNSQTELEGAGGMSRRRRGDRAEARQAPFSSLW